MGHFWTNQPVEQKLGVTVNSSVTVGAVIAGFFALLGALFAGLPAWFQLWDKRRLERVSKKGDDNFARND
jgi:uncharacterized protein (DUF2062 family)